MLRADIRGDDLVFARLVALALLSFVAASSAAEAQLASPEMVVCHDYATKKYIEDFRRVGSLQTSLNDDAPTVVTVFQNDSLRYEEYLAECMKRRTLEKAK
jgi:hypothetical protein